MLIQITNRCHMGCKHCMQDATPKGKHMNDETFEQVMDFCMEAMPIVVAVTPVTTEIDGVKHKTYEITEEL